MRLVNPKLLLLSSGWLHVFTATTLASAISWSVILPSADRDLLLTFSVIIQPIMFIERYFMVLVCP